MFQSPLLRGNGFDCTVPGRIEQMPGAFQSPLLRGNGFDGSFRTPSGAEVKRFSPLFFGATASTLITCARRRT